MSNAHLAPSHKIAGSSSGAEQNSTGSHKRTADDALTVPALALPPQKRANPGDMPGLSDADAAVERELAALVSQLNSRVDNSQDNTGVSEASGTHDSGALSLEDQIDGVLATMNAAHISEPRVGEDAADVLANALGGHRNNPTADGTQTQNQQPISGPSLSVPGDASQEASISGPDAHKPTGQPNTPKPEPVPEPKPPKQTDDHLAQLQRQLLEAVGQEPSAPGSQPETDPSASAETPATTSKTSSEPALDDSNQPILGTDQLTRQARRQSAAALDTVSAQILDLLSQGYYQEVLNLVTQPESERGRVYYALVDAFESLKRLFVTKSAFIPSEIPGLSEYRDLAAITHRANLATFCAACFGTIEVGFKELNDRLLDILIPFGSRRILKSHIPIILNLKTQAYIASFDGSEKPRKEILDELFPPDLTEKLMATHPDRPELSPGEADYVARSQRRREYLEKEQSQESLTKEYQWVYFLRELSEFIMKSHNSSTAYGWHTQLAAAQESAAKSVVASTVTTTEQEVTKDSPPIKDNANPSAGDSSNSTADASAIVASTTPVKVTAPRPVAARTRASKIRARAAPATANTASAGAAAKSSTGSADTNPSSTSPPSRRGNKPVIKSDKPDESLRVYEAARSSTEGMEAVRQIKTANLTRRSWTKEEEEALLRGLDRVQGPYWAQILELYGLGGSISEVLKDRNQVQLKDKARNLKMFMVRCGLPLPAVFEYVTGDWEARRGRGRRIRDRENAARQKRSPDAVAADAANEQASEAASAGPNPGKNGTLSTADVNKTESDIDAAVAQLQEAKASKPSRSTASPPQVPPLQCNSLPPDTDPDAQAAQAVERALDFLQEQDNNQHDKRQIQHLLQSVGDYING